MFYMVLTVVVMYLTRPVTADLLFEGVGATVMFFSRVAHLSTLLLPLFVAMPLVTGFRTFLSNAHLIGYAVFGSVLLQVGFSFLKCTIPMVVPFYADPALAAFDKWLHGGVDPWVVVHDWAQFLPLHELLPFYLTVWAVPAIALALIIAVSDRDPERTARFLILYVGCWVILGNVVALAGSSAGPVFYDALLGGDRFAGLHVALKESGVLDTRIGLVQRYLWAGYTEQGLAFGSGISAFPSVHVGIAAIVALYLAERSRWLALPGFAFLGIILLLSVYTGYHYAVDGYFSVLFIAGCWAMLRRVRLTDISTPLFWLRSDYKKPVRGAA